MKKVLVFLLLIGLFFSSCSSGNKDETKKEKQISALVAIYKNQQLDVSDALFVIPNYKEKGDSINIFKAGNIWVYSYDISVDRTIRVVIDSVIYKNR